MPRNTCSTRDREAVSILDLLLLLLLLLLLNLSP